MAQLAYVEDFVCRLSVLNEDLRAFAAGLSLFDPVTAAADNHSVALTLQIVDALFRAAGLASQIEVRAERAAALLLPIVSQHGGDRRSRLAPRRDIPKSIRDLTAWQYKSLRQLAKQSTSRFERSLLLLEHGARRCRLSLHRSSKQVSQTPPDFDVTARESSPEPTAADFTQAAQNPIKRRNSSS